MLILYITDRNLIHIVAWIWIIKDIQLWYMISSYIQLRIDYPYNIFCSKYLWMCITYSSMYSDSFLSSGPLAPINPSKGKALNNYRREFCHGNAQVIGLNVVAVKGRRSDESDRYSKWVTCGKGHQHSFIPLFNFGHCKERKAAVKV